MAYILLGGAIVLELAATSLLKYSYGFSKLYPTIGCLVSYFLCFFLFSKALKTINLGAAYATWSGVGIVVSAIVSSVIFGEKLNLTGNICLVIIVTGCVVLNLFGVASAE